MFGCGHMAVCLCGHMAVCLCGHMARYPYTGIIMSVCVCQYRTICPCGYMLYRHMAVCLREYWKVCLQRAYDCLSVWTQGYLFGHQTSRIRPPILNDISINYTVMYSFHNNLGNSDQPYRHQQISLTSDESSNMGTRVSLAAIPWSTSWLWSLIGTDRNTKYFVNMITAHSLIIMT